MVSIFHNPRCRKSREALGLLEEKGEMTTVIDYLKTPPSREELAGIIQKIGIRPAELVRKGEQEFKDHFKGRELSDDEWLDALIKFPKLIERPIVIKDDQAVIGRPPEKVLDIL